MSNLFLLSQRQMGKPSAEAALRRVGSQAENSAYGQEYAQSLRAA